MSGGAEQHDYAVDLDRFTGVIGADGVVYYRNDAGGSPEQVEHPATSMDQTEAEDAAQSSTETSEPNSSDPAPETASQHYRRIVLGGAAAYMAAQQKREEARAQLSEFRGWVDTCLAKLYKTYPHFSPEVLRSMEMADTSYLQQIDIRTVPTTPPEEAMLEHTHAAGSNWAQNLAVSSAVASMRQYEGADTHRNFARVMQQPAVHVPVRRYLLRHLSLFRYGGAADLEDKTLKPFDLTQEHLDIYSKLPQILPTDNITSLPRLDAPPLHLMQLAVDVVNRNATSAMPTGLQTKLPGRQQPQGLKELVNDVTDALTDYVTRKYRYETPPSRRVIAALAECDLAERQGFRDAPVEAQYRTANRLHGIFSRVKREQIPEAVRDIYDRCREITVVPNYSRR